MQGQESFDTIKCYDNQQMNSLDKIMTMSLQPGLQTQPIVHNDGSVEETQSDLMNAFNISAEKYPICDKGNVEQISKLNKNERFLCLMALVRTAEDDRFKNDHIHQF